MHANYLRLFDYYGGKPARLFCFDQNRNIATQSNASKLVNSGKLDALHFTEAACIPSTNNVLRLVDSVCYQALGKVTPRCPWYLPPRSLYDVSQTSSLSKNSTWAQPSPA